MGIIGEWVSRGWFINKFKIDSPLFSMITTTRLDDNTPQKKRSYFDDSLLDGINSIGSATVCEVLFSRVI